MNTSLRLTFTEAPQKKGPPSTPLDGPFVSRHATRFAARAGDDNVAAGALVARSPVPPIPAPTPPVPDPGGVGSDGHACNFKSARRRARSLKIDRIGTACPFRKAINMPRCRGAIGPHDPQVMGAIARG